MIKDMLFGKTIAPLSGKCLDAYAMRHKAIANNLANIEVKGYDRREVKFENELKECLRRENTALNLTNEKHIPVGCKLEKVQPRFAIDKANPKLNAINNVDVDLEAADMGKNQIDFDTIATVLRIEYQRLRMAIRGQ